MRTQLRDRNSGFQRGARVRLSQKRGASGQSIVDYTACIAFVACLIALCFHLAQGGFFASISQAYSNPAREINALNQYVNNP